MIRWIKGSKRRISLDILWPDVTLQEAVLEARKERIYKMGLQGQEVGITLQSEDKKNSNA